MIKGIQFNDVIGIPDFPVVVMAEISFFSPNDIFAEITAIKVPGHDSDLSWSIRHDKINELEKKAIKIYKGDALGVVE
jgi:hypothetical protein